MKNFLKIFIFVLFFNLVLVSFTLAEETAPSTEVIATSTPASASETTSTSTPETVAPLEEQATSTPLVEPAPQPTSPLAPETPAPAPPLLPVEPAPQLAPSPVEGPAPAPVIDPATAPSKVIIRVIMPDATPPPFPVFVTFVGVGNKNFGGKINANGELTVIMPSGRYYTDLLVISTEYVQGEDGPSFFLEANEERDFGVIRLMPKSEMTSQSLADKSLEEDILAQAESAKGIGKILVLIVKLLMKILEEVRNIASILMNK